MPNAVYEHAHLGLPSLGRSRINDRRALPAQCLYASQAGAGAPILTWGVVGGSVVAELPPILAGKHFFAPSVFEPENLPPRLAQQILRLEDGRSEKMLSGQD